MDLIQTQKDKIENKIADVLLTHIENGQVTQDEIPLISYFVLEHIDTLQTQEDLVGFINELVMKWPIFASLKIIIEGESKEQAEGVVAQDVTMLTQQGRLEEALQLAKSATNR